MSKKESNPPFNIGGELILPGVSKTIHLPIATLFHHSDLVVRVVNGRRPGPRLFISSTIHGDELNGIEVIRRVLRSPWIKYIKGTLIAVPIVNISGMLTQSRYLLDRRDLNRSFPGSENGSAAAQLAHMFLKEIVEKCTHGIDLHTGSDNRINLPQIRCDFKSKEALGMAGAFGAPVILKSALREGSLREASEALGIPTLIFEGGEALRFNEDAIRTATSGVFRVMALLGMIPSKKAPLPKIKSIISPTSQWVRAPNTGIFNSTCFLGKKVCKGDIIGNITDPLGTSSMDVVAHLNGIVVGRTQLPVVYKGDALFNIAWVPDPTKAEEIIEAMEEESFNPALGDPLTY